MKYMHYYASKTVKFVQVSEGRPVPSGPRIKVSGKREARALAAKVGAKPWNF